MPVTYGTYTKQVKLLPLMLAADGSATVSVRFGYVGADGAFEAVAERTVQASAADVSSMLDAAPTPGLTRRDDLSLAVYTWLVTAGHIEPGTVS